MERRVVALCGRPTLRSWVEAEIGDFVRWRLYATTVGDMMKLLTRGDGSHSELLLLDMDLMTAPSTFVLANGLDERWWRGTIVALGATREMHRRYLTFDRAFERPFGSEALRTYIEKGQSETTQPIVSWPRVP